MFELRGSARNTWLRVTLLVTLCLGLGSLVYLHTVSGRWNWAQLPREDLLLPRHHVDKFAEMRRSISQRYAVAQHRPRTLTSGSLLTRDVPEVDILTVRALLTQRFNLPLKTSFNDQQLAHVSRKQIIARLDGILRERRASPRSNEWIASSLMQLQHA
ncbi:hypothetical protein IWQ60_001942 [Tieghemiomyces parasiticus]|uniref:Uncharacterized protein n=1 Tax=Tieghemiomyces parasiticus TaxID=78921 RepID=A0A9W8AD32_9FUNG|nr:hypothetical protein IWQ60_001942 [Tieghemiomyces parasiticus]